MEKVKNLKVITLVLVSLIVLSFTSVCAQSEEGKLKDVSEAAKLNSEGIGLLQKSEVLDARKKFESAHDKDPLSPEYPNNIGFTYLLLKDEEKAELYFKKSLEIDPDFFRAHYNLGVLYQKKENVAKALEYYKTATENNPNFPEARYNLALMYMRKGDKKKAIESFEIFIKIAAPEMKQPVQDAKVRISELSK
ncbi:tetratricopeptide repeat protein [Leptospira bandrabouensis]|uniref:Tetratricopeptide repeat protein n=1 Tax=Leptospira bandrabouensis TaxID=2484903 RepID=A0A6H3NRB6_9LEPT|nr:tetratricopeptide repeat protein [Leptospira bandrabouensis]TGN13637.1 tetratricopeptide repeat protein [Leptospira bandrabouensis]